MDRVGDWWNSVFNSTSSDPTVATVPEVKLPDLKLDPPALEPPPKSLDMAQTPASPVVPPPADAPVVASDPQRVPSFPRPLDTPARPVDSVPGTQVYRSPDAVARMPDPSQPADVVRGPAQSVRVAPSYPPTTGSGASTSAMGAASATSPGSAARTRAGR